MLRKEARPSKKKCQEQDRAWAYKQVKIFLGSRVAAQVHRSEGEARMDFAGKKWDLNFWTP